MSNAGSRFTGTNQVNAQLALNNPGGHGDQAALSLVAAEDLRYAGLGYSSRSAPMACARARATPRCATAWAMSSRRSMPTR